ncbi:hypothetical protein C8R44DRAFT_879442 [Mycena epipterygia]|nr:hypothetical protein C8R44DRAFT_879442 [Mycena epipterygia]
MDPGMQKLMRSEFARQTPTGPDTTICGGCGGASPDHQCRDCFWASYLCAQCIVAKHAAHPLHYIQTWTGSSLERGSLLLLGLRLQLGHGPGGHCPTPVADDEFCIIDSRGMHHVAIDYCGCARARSRGTQLRQARLLPMGIGLPAAAIMLDLALISRNHPLTPL